MSWVCGKGLALSGEPFSKMETIGQRRVERELDVIVVDSVAREMHFTIE